MRLTRKRVEILVAATDEAHAEDLAGLRAPEALRLAADRLRRSEPTIRGIVWS